MRNTHAIHIIELTSPKLVHIISQLSTHHSGITTVEAMLTHSSPCLSYTHFHSPLVGSSTTHQSHCSMSAATICSSNTCTINIQTLLSVISVSHHVKQEKSNKNSRSNVFFNLQVSSVANFAAKFITCHFISPQD